ncbi:MAG: transporter substrate-binding domain-containing protein, partial [Actinobacteria bacterium]|nr:transporter substrate-binding domain-containing protein [Actinomycetota bacterium]
MDIQHIDRRHFLGAGAGLMGTIVLGGALGACSSGSKPAATGGGSGPAASGLAAYRQNGLRLAYITNPPFSFADPKTGEITGAGPVVLRELLTPYGITKLDYSLVQFASEIPTVTSKRADMTANNFNANATRCAQIGFTNPVALYHQGALVHRGNPKDLHSYDDIAKNSSVRIAVLRGDASIAWLKSYGVGTDRLLQFDALPQAVTAVNQGRA